jgi:putative acetyltransferase
VIAVEDPRAGDVHRLLERHWAFSQETTLPEDIHALDLDGLVDPAVTFYGARREGVLVGIGALKELDPVHAELKSMHTAAAARGRRVGRAMVQHLLAEAGRRGYRQVSIETGAGDDYAPARAMYAGLGFTPCGRFGGYRASPNSAFMTRAVP